MTEEKSWLNVDENTIFVAGGAYSEGTTIHNNPRSKLYSGLITSFSTNPTDDRTEHKKHNLLSHSAHHAD